MSLVEILSGSRNVLQYSHISGKFKPSVTRRRVPGGIEESLASSEAGMEVTDLMP